VITPILAFGLPVVDTGMTMARRLISGRPLFQGDGEHIHHMLLARGWSQRRVVMILYAVCAVFGLLAALSTKTSSPVTGLVLFVIAAAVIIAVGHLRYHEVDELRAGMKRTVGDRRLRVANNIRVRRASLALTKAHSLNEMFEAVGNMLEFEEFVYANAQIGQVSHAAANERAYMHAKRKGSLEGLEFVNGRIAWSWSGEAISAEDVIGSSEHWCFRLPLATDNGDWGWMNLYRPLAGPPLLLDMNYLASFLQTELSAAAERILRVQPTHSSFEKLSLPVTAEKSAG
jgi:UDP-GlcNAc:undecaprenyl-phosphate GlcNAc-1-phosphate transferase